MRRGPGRRGRAADAFFSSFEPGDPQPAHGAVDRDARGQRRASGVRGPAPTGIAGTSSPAPATFYTLTSGQAAGRGRQAWTLQGSTDGTTWIPIDTRRGERFPWRRQARPFQIARSGPYTRYRLQIRRRPGPLTLAEIELLAANPEATPR